MEGGRCREGFHEDDLRNGALAAALAQAYRPPEPPPSGAAAASSSSAGAAGPAGPAAADSRPSRTSAPDPLQLLHQGVNLKNDFECLGE